METLTIRNKKVFFWQSGDASLPTLLLLHGFRGSHVGLLPLAEHLTGFRVIIPDLPGYGRSEPLEQEHDFATYAAWVVEFCDALSIAQCHLLGHSFGGSLAIVLASAHPDRWTSLTLLAPVTARGTFAGFLGEAYYRIGSILPPVSQKTWLANKTINRFTARLLMTTTNPIIRQAVLREEDANMRNVIPHVEVESFLGYYRTPLLEYAHSITTPTIIIAGKKDRMVTQHSLHELHGAILQSRLELLDNAGHFLQHENSNDVAARMTEFLLQHPGRMSSSSQST